MVYMIKPNSRETDTLTGIPVRDRESARGAARYLLQRGVGAVAVQAGDEGNLIITPDDEYWFPKICVQSIRHWRRLCLGTEFSTLPTAVSGLLGLQSLKFRVSSKRVSMAGSSEIVSFNLCRRISELQLHVRLPTRRR